MLVLGYNKITYKTYHVNKLTLKFAINVNGFIVIIPLNEKFQEKFIYKGTVYRIDAESIIGHNLRQ